MSKQPLSKQEAIRHRIHEIIFEADTPAGKAFDVGLLIAIIFSVLVVMLESVPQYGQTYAGVFNVLEWGITVLFTLEYALRIYSIRRPWKYIFSFYGLVDLLSILPTYLSLFIPASQYLITIRALRLLRVFRILKLTQYLTESAMLMEALRASRRKIIIFLGTVITIVCIIGTSMYLIESGPDSKFDSIPKSMYWAIVTITTVGYGDIAPTTALGQFLSAVLMIIGYAILAVPTGIVSVEMANVDARMRKKAFTTTSCHHCSAEGHDADALYCKYCGEKL